MSSIRAGSCLHFFVCFAVLGPMQACDGGGGGGPHDASDDRGAFDADGEAAGDPDAVEEEAPGDGSEAADSTDGEEHELPAAAENWNRDILSTDLIVDLETLEASAAIRLAPSEEESASFEAGGLEIFEVRTPGGVPLDYSREGLRLDVGVPSGGEFDEIVVEYAFSVQGWFEGYMETGATLTWPYWCGNLFPCHSDPADGVIFTLEVTGAGEDREAVYPERIDSQAPSYQLAWAEGEYVYSELGTTGGGTVVGVWHYPDDEGRALEGTGDLVGVFDWYERTLGPYAFGGRTGAVEVTWGPGAYGGMEHHPYWHVSDIAIADAAVHAHEAAHGWFGDGVRIRCWEDFVLSEGTVSYLQARVLGQVVGPDAEQEVWDGYERELDLQIARDDRIVWPDSCGEVDILESGLFSRTVYMKGAFFYRAVAGEIGASELDRVLGKFYSRHVGRAAGMQDMLDLIREETGFDPTGTAEGWLRSLGRPDR